MSGPPGGAAPRRWVCCADDFALDTGAIDGIIDLIERGRVTATSALVDAPSWRSGARALPAGAPGNRADVGLHLNLTQSFARPGAAVWPLPELILRCRLGLLPRAIVRQGIERQLDTFEDALGRPPDYVDGHQHVHQFAGVREALLAALGARYGTAGPWLRSTLAPPAERNGKARFIASLGDRSLRRLAAAAGRPVSACLVGVYDFAGGRADYEARLRGWMRAGPEGSVLMCHPARSAQGDDPIGAARSTEYAVLASAMFAEALAAARIELTNGTSLFAGAAAGH